MVKCRARPYGKQEAKMPPVSPSHSDSTAVPAASRGIRRELLGLVPSCVSVTVGSSEPVYWHLRTAVNPQYGGCGRGDAEPWGWHVWCWYLTCPFSSDTTAGLWRHAPERGCWFGFILLFLICCSWFSRFLRCCFLPLELVILLWSVTCLPLHHRRL